MVDQLEVWQVVSVLGLHVPRPAEEPLTEAPAGRRRFGPVSDVALIKARYAAHERGEPEPTWLFGAPRLVGVPD